MNRAAESQRIIRDVCKRFNIRRSLLISKDRHWVNVWPRFIAIALIRESTGMTEVKIARIFRVTQQTVDNALGAVKDMEETSKYARSDLAIMRMRLGIGYSCPLIHEKLVSSQMVNTAGHPRGGGPKESFT